MPQLHDGATEVPASFTLGEWSVDPMLNRISRDGHAVQLRPRAMDVLVFLARQPGEVATKELIIDSIWRTEFVTENALTHVISELRTELGDDAKSPRYIENIPRRGYRLIAEVSVDGSHDPELAQVVQMPVASGAKRFDEDINPYPGLAPFTEHDAGFFFGRELEVAQMWRNITSRRLLGLIGPSGVGKSSFLRAGLIPSTPDGWGVLIFQPGENPVLVLARTLVPEFAGDVEAIEKLFDIRDGRGVLPIISRWRERHERALLIVDQFEELFTLNPRATQDDFVDLLGTLTDDSELHIVLSMRDDFLHRCHAHGPLRPIFDHLTALEQPAVEQLRRALVEPAHRLGFSFEDNRMPAEMIAEVEDERGALPLLAFSVAELWDRRDRDGRLLTRSAYDAIGGVSGSLARHADVTLESLGPDRLPIVRELFRNLVTAENTRATRDRNELLSVFPSDLRDAGEDVIQRLLDARLLTSYEENEDASESVRHVEIIHESLLANWPRLIKWRSQDADAARSRDDLRQAARTWNERGRNKDLLWTGSAFREFQVWREHYPGGLTEVEEAFAAAMTSFAARRALRRRTAAAAAFAVLLAGLVVVGSFWRQSVRETRRAEASKLLALGQLALQEERTRALAYAVASLEMTDTPEARHLALRALWAGPPATIVSGNQGAWWIAFSPDGGQLVFGDGSGVFHVHSADRRPPVELSDFKRRGKAISQNFSPDGRHLVGWASDAGNEIRIWNTERWQNERVLHVEDAGIAWGVFGADSETVFSVGFQFSGGRTVSTERSGRYIIHRWPLDGSEPEFVGSLDATLSPFAQIDFTRDLLAVGRGDTLLLHRIETLGSEPARIVGRYPEAFALRSAIAFEPKLDRVAASDAGGNLLVWAIDGDGKTPELRFQAPRDPMFTTFSHDGRFLAHASRKGFRLWDLDGPTAAEAVTFEGGGRHIALTPDDRWLATAGFELGVALWPLTLPYCRLLNGHEGGAAHLAFSADGSHLFTQGDDDGKVLSWDLSGGGGIEPTVIFRTTPQWGWGLEVDPKGRFLIVGTVGGAWRVPLDGGEPVLLDGFPRQGNQLDPTGRYLAGSVLAEHRTKNIDVLDLDTGERHTFEPPGPDWGRVGSYDFDHTGRLLVSRGGTLSRWDLENRLADVLIEEDAWSFALGPNGQTLLAWIEDRPHLVDLETGDRNAVELPGGETILGPGPSGVFTITRTEAGEILVGPIESPIRHLLLGHEGFIRRAVASPDGRWVASAGSDGTLRLWPMPDFSRPPLHSLPHDELMATLKNLTNLRVVPDDQASTGYRVEANMDAYRGWQTTPEW